MALEYEDVMTIKRLKNEDELTYKEIEQQTGHAPATISKALKMPEKEIEALKKTPTPSELKGVSKSKEALAPTRVRRIGEEAIADRAISDYSKLLKYGNFIEDNIEAVAENEGFDSVIKFIMESTDFYVYNKGKIHKLENELEFYKTLLARIISDVKGHYDKDTMKGELRDLILTGHIAKTNVPEFVYDSYIKLLRR